LLNKELINQKTDVNYSADILGKQTINYEIWNLDYRYNKFKDRAIGMPGGIMVTKEYLKRSCQEYQNEVWHINSQIPKAPKY
jgi:hypothetical protein